MPHRSTIPAVAVVATAVLWLLACMPALAQVQVRAWLDRDRIALGETATLNVEVSGGQRADSPDFSALARDFEIGGQSSRERISRDAGGASTLHLYAVALQPRRSGTLLLPPLAVAGSHTAALRLEVTAAVPARARGAVFIERELDQSSAWVQQSLGYVVRLHYATQLLSGQLDQDAPDGAALQRVGSDLQYTRDIGGRRFTVVERRFVLVPERSGMLPIPPPRFSGRGVGGFFDGMFGDGQRALSAVGEPLALEVRPVPPSAAQPWLPLRALSLRYATMPGSARAGEAVTVVVEATADGATATQMPELVLEAVDGAQVFPEPPQVDERFEQGRPQLRLTRRFAVVPAHAGVLRIAGPGIAWFDATSGVPREATLEPLTLRVQPSPRAAAADRAASAAPVRDVAEQVPADAGWIRVPGIQGEVRPWALATVVFALLWLATLAWGLHRRTATPPVAAAGEARADAGAAARGRGAEQRLREALDTGDFGDVATALLATAPAPYPCDLDALRARLADPAQQDAVSALQRARWGGGDGVDARRRLREAFARSPDWVAVADARPRLLPPLYPDHRG